ncbi:MAG: acetyl-CoA carboxylase biotin carboxylase subunit [Flavobacteriales bacterium]|nr:acetyl-CoA carboxylase biotin carboxylase subunit [Flavobacteriales bacterium]
MKKVLIANRGEIALRVMQSIKEMGICTVAIYSDVDRLSPHVKYADEAVYIGPAPSSESYLKGDEIIKICKDLKVDAIHPGYGFLSENSNFAKSVVDSGINFIGPDYKAIKIMGDKLSAKEAVKKFNVPMVPGTDSPITDYKTAKKIANSIGYPILIKASAGGGGKGMRIVDSEKLLEEQMSLAGNEALSSFGDGTVFIEKYISSPRHIEIQVLSDKHGNVVYLFERECSIQRRHQKVVEEAPSVILTDDLRKLMGEAAVNVARACNYIGAGTVEFLLDENNNFYFLEMNTRLQVEHPVTEMITGIDLVKEQIKVARGEKLSFNQDDLKINGHSIEIRVYAEDPKNNFLPDIGKLIKYVPPKGVGVRVDDGFEEGMDIPIYYDPMISKLITYGKDRDEAIEKMIRAIDDYTIIGVNTTLSFGKFVMKHPLFKKGKFDTHFVKNHFDINKLDNYDKSEGEVAAILAAKLFNKNKEFDIQINPFKVSNWKRNRRID